jgi:hypothetical protein
MSYLRVFLGIVIATASLTILSDTAAARHRVFRRCCCGAPTTVDTSQSAPARKQPAILLQHEPDATTAPLRIECNTPDLKDTYGIITLLHRAGGWELCFAPREPSPANAHYHIPVEATEAKKLLRNASYLIDKGYRANFGEKPAAKPSRMRVSMILDSASESADYEEMRSWDYPQDFDDVSELHNYFEWLAKRLPPLKKLMDKPPTREGR